VRAFLSPSGVPSVAQVSGRVCRQRGRLEDCCLEGCSCQKEGGPERPGESNVEGAAGLEEDSMQSDASVRGPGERDRTCLWSFCDRLEE
jgi:hypothetical protein